MGVGFSKLTPDFEGKVMGSNGADLSDLGDLSDSGFGIVSDVTCTGSDDSVVMCTGVACGAECNQVLLGIIAGMTPKLFVVDLQVRHRAARLTPPGIATQDLLPQPVVRRRIQPQARKFWANRAHDAFSLRPSRNACRCSSGRNLKNLVIENSSISGSPWSRLAPARKSAQIICKQ